jgi:hypothetical protein
VVAKDKEGLAVKKQERHKFHKKKLNLKRLSFIEDK